MKFKWILALTLTFSAAAGIASESSYSPGGWPTLHHDPGNRRAVNAQVLGRRYSSWNALQGASVLTAPVTSPDGQQIYATTALPSGNSNLHAFSIDGELLWQSSPWSDAFNGIDPCAFLSSPIVDRGGDIYISDCNQLFAFKPDGSEKWTIPLPAPREDDWKAAGDHPVNAFTTAAFTADGKLLGVTNFGDVLIVDRATGAVLNQAYRLPSLLSPYSRTVELPDSLLANGLMDIQFKEWAWQLIFGGSMRSANTPAVSKSNRVFVVGSSQREGIGALFGLDITGQEGQLQIQEAFITEIGIGSGSSPALSPGEHQVYVSDEEGWFYCLSTDSGEILWKVKTTAAAGAAGVGPDGTVYALQQSGSAVVAIRPDGEILWHSDTSSLNADLPASVLFGDPVQAANGNPTITSDAVVVPIITGYALPFTVASIPVSSHVVALDLETGKLVEKVITLIDDSSGITGVLPNGSLVNSLGAVMTSAMAPLKPLVDLLLPGNIEMLATTAGIQVSLPEPQVNPISSTKP